MFDYDFPWIKFTLLSVVFMVIIFFLCMKTPLGFLWKVGFILCAPVGVYFAIAGKSLRSGRYAK